MQDDGVDPLDAFMANEVNPEVRAREEEEAKKREEELRERAKLRAVSLHLFVFPGLGRVEVTAANSTKILGHRHA